MYHNTWGDEEKCWYEACKLYRLGRVVLWRTNRWQMQSGIYSHCVIVMHMFNKVVLYNAVNNVIHVRTCAWTPSKNRITLNYRKKGLHSAVVSYTGDIYNPQLQQAWFHFSENQQIILTTVTLWIWAYQLDHEWPCVSNVKAKSFRRRVLCQHLLY